ncbi:MAG: hypothetical protein E7F48_10145, partial [Streptococcus oralis]|nr:hypothetical protein [Streptococcus oralis]
GEYYFAFVAVVQNTKRGGIKCCRDFVHEDAGIQFAKKIWHYGHAVITHGFTLVKAAATAELSPYTTEKGTCIGRRFAETAFFLPGWIGL